MTANEDGFYNVPACLPAFTPSALLLPDSRRRSVTGVDLHVNENKTVNLELQVGQVTETVTVTSEVDAG